MLQASGGDPHGFKDIYGQVSSSMHCDIQELHDKFYQSQNDDLYLSLKGYRHLCGISLASEIDG
jgi:hypothetical protein